MSAKPETEANPAPSQTVRIAYAAHTDAGTFLLDREGICRGFVPSPDRSGAFRVRPEAADRCIGAQYVAAIDVTEPGALVQLPRVGAALLLGIVDANGRISLIRTGPIVRYETLDGAHDKPSEIKLDIDWDDESTVASAPTPTPTPTPPAELRSRANAITLDAEGPAPATALERPSEPTAVCFRAGELLRSARPLSAVPEAAPTPVVALVSSEPFCSDDQTPAKHSIRQSVPLGSGSRLVDPDEPTLTGRIRAESSGRRT